MSEDDFVRNNRGCNGGVDFDPNYLRSIYRAIKAHEIVMGDLSEAAGSGGGGSGEAAGDNLSETSSVAATAAAEESEGDSLPVLIGALWGVLWPALRPWLDEKLLPAALALLASLGPAVEIHSVLTLAVERFPRPSTVALVTSHLGPWLKPEDWQCLLRLVPAGHDEGDLAGESKLLPVEAASALIASLSGHPHLLLAVARENRDRLPLLWKPLQAAWSPSVAGTVLLGGLAGRVEGEAQSSLLAWIIERCQMHLAQGVSQSEAETLLSLALSQISRFHSPPSSSSIGSSLAAPIAPSSPIASASSSSLPKCDAVVWPHFFTLLGMATRMPHTPTLSPLVLGLLLAPVREEGILFPVDFMAEYVDMLVTFIGTARQETEHALRALHHGLVGLEGHLRRLPDGK